MKDHELKSLVDHLNAKHYNDIVVSLDNPNSLYNQQLEQIRAAEISQRAWKNGKKDMRLLAVLTPEQDAAFSRAYGPNYHRDPNFFKKEFPQTLALAKKDL
jgi:hypothetical protein